MSAPSPQFVLITHEVPAAFLHAARRFEIDPAGLARVLCCDFALDPPDELLIIERDDWPLALIQ